MSFWEDFQLVEDLGRIRRRHLSSNLSRAKSRAKAQFIGIDVNYLLEIGEKQGWKCALTGRPLEFKRSGEKTKININSCSIDRINSTAGYIEGNVQLVVAAVNKMKSDFEESVFKKICGEVSVNDPSVL